jgi:antitoxin component of MazEF toxin-antitoxin module
MHLQKQLSRAVEGKEYPKYVLIIPPSTIDELQWKEGQELDHEVKDRSLIIRKTHQTSEEDTLKLAAKYAKRKHK